MASRITRPRKQPSDPPVDQQARAKWTNSLTKILVDLMVEQLQKGGKEKNTLGKKEWSSICDEFRRKSDLTLDREQLKNRCAILKKQYVAVKSILNRDGFTLHEFTGIIMATEEVWDEYIKEHPDAESIKTYGCPMYKELCIIFGKLDCSNAHETDFILSCSEHLSAHAENFWSESDEADKVAGGRETSQPSASISSNRQRKRGRKSVEGSFAGGILEMAAASRLWTDAVQEQNARYSVADCIKELDEMQGLEDHVYYAALELFNKRIARETFLSLKRDRRFIWLRRKSNAHSTALLIQQSLD